jgi:hypothetical protein
LLARQAATTKVVEIAAGVITTVTGIEVVTMEVVTVIVTGIVETIAMTVVEMTVKMVVVVGSSMMMTFHSKE